MKRFAVNVLMQKDERTHVNLQSILDIYEADSAEDAKGKAIVRTMEKFPTHLASLVTYIEIT